MLDRPAADAKAHACQIRTGGCSRQTAAYWRWRAQVWPQDPAADVHDLLEARHHLLQAGDSEDADQVTEQASGELHTWDAWDQETSLIHDTLARLQTGSSRQATWIGRLGNLARARGDYEEAARQYQRALDIFERLGDQAGMAGGRTVMSDPASRTMAVRGWRGRFRALWRPTAHRGRRLASVPSGRR